MNRLKHILGARVPRHISSNVALVSRDERHSGARLRNRQFASQPPTSGLFAPKRNYSVDDGHARQLRRDRVRLISKESVAICKQRGRASSSSVTSLKKLPKEKRLSLENIAARARRYSTWRDVSGRRELQTVAATSDESSAICIGDFAFVEKLPRSYAQMIADYSEALARTSIARYSNDTSLFANAKIRENPFAALSTRSGENTAKTVNCDCKASARGGEERHFVPPRAQIPLDPPCTHRPDVANVENDDLQQHDTNTSDEQIAAADWSSEDRACATLLADCGVFNSFPPLNGGLTPRRFRVLARNPFDSFATPTRHASSTNARGTSRRATATGAGMSSIAKPAVAAKSDTGASKPPRVELRMVPSEKESVVSINVDSARTKTSLGSSSPTTDELSVVVRSDRKQSSTRSQLSAPVIRGSVESASRRGGDDFGPMRISIEDSTPIKQIEFSINGEPVSELKSITARTEKLDVVTSADNTEIRIPFAKDEAGATSQNREDELWTRASQPVLNMQISASFQRPPARASAERSTGATTASATPTALSTSQTSKIATSTAGHSEARRRESESSDTRVPSSIVPWWASSDSFGKIRKKEDNREPSPSDTDKKKLSGTSAKIVPAMRSSDEEHELSAAIYGVDEYNWPPKKIESIDNVLDAKAKIKSILDAVKPIERKEDGTLIDYGSNVSSGSATLRAHGGVKEKRSQNSSAAATKTKRSTPKGSEAKSKIPRSLKLDSNRQLFERLIMNEEIDPKNSPSGTTGGVQERSAYTNESSSSQTSSSLTSEMKGRAVIEDPTDKKREEAERLPAHRYADKQKKETDLRNITGIASRNPAGDNSSSKHREEIRDDRNSVGLTSASSKTPSGSAGTRSTVSKNEHVRG